MLFCTFTYMCIWVYGGEVAAKRLRERYLEAVLRQNIAFFDDVGAGAVATHIQTDTRKSFAAIDASWPAHLSRPPQILSNEAPQRNWLSVWSTSVPLLPGSFWPMSGTGGLRWRCPQLCPACLLWERR